MLRGKKTRQVVLENSLDNHKMIFPSNQKKIINIASLETTKSYID